VLAGEAIKRAARPTYRHTLRFVPVRSVFPEMLNGLGLLGTGVEVGVKLGEFSEQILAGWHGRTLISVDVWSTVLERDPANPVEDQPTLDRIYAKARLRLGPFGDRSQVWRLESTEAAERIDPGSLDFVYIDAQHEREAVEADLAAWRDRVRPGGLLAGHDYYDGWRHGCLYGVKTAVDAMCAEHRLPLACTRFDAPETTWMVRIPPA